MRKLKTKECVFCKNTITQKYTCSEKEWVTKRKFCNRECARLFQIGRKQSREQAEKRVRTLLNNGRPRIGYDWYKQKALERDNWTCQKCGWNEPLIMEVDHIIPKVKDSSLENDLQNLVTLCPNCHRRKTLINKENLARKHA